MSAKTKTAKKAPVNISATARKHGTSRETIRAWRDSGVDITDAKAVAAKVSLIRSNTTDESLTDAKRRKAQADADLARLRADREAKKLVEIEAVDQAVSQIGAIVRSRLLGMRSDLVHELQGRSGEQIYMILDKRFCELLESFQDPTDKLLNL